MLNSICWFLLQDGKPENQDYERRHDDEQCTLKQRRISEAERILYIVPPIKHLYISPPSSLDMPLLLPILHLRVTAVSDRPI